MGDVDLRGIGKRHRFALVLGAEHDIDDRQRGPHRDAERSRVVPLVRAEVQIEHNRRPRGSGLLGGENSGAATRLFAQAGAGELKHAAVLDRRLQDIVDGELIVRAIVAVIGAYLSALCKNPLHTATQFALLTAFAAFGRTYLSSSAGFIAAATGWVWFFAICALAGLPSLVLLAWLQKRGHFDGLVARKK